MGDCCLVTLTLTHAGHEEFRRQPWYDRPSREEPGHDLAAQRRTRSVVPPKTARVDLEYEGINYGRLDFLHQLEDLGLAYDVRVHGGADYGPGMRHCRFHPSGKKQIIEYDDDEETLPLDKLMRYIQHRNLDGLVHFIRQHHAAITPLPWDNQDAYGKVHRTRRLIGTT